MKFHRIITSAIASLILSGSVVAAETESDSQKVNYTPQIHGVLRARWEGEINNGDFTERFEVRNARVSLSGKVLPTLDYFIQIDACDRGTMKILDAYAKWGFAGDWRVQAGQFRVPFGVDCFRAPGNYYFGNRSFIGKDILNMREVGAKVGYYGTKIPLTVEGGVFNSVAMSNHDKWQKSMNYAAKASYRVGNVTFSAGYASIEPDSVRINIADGAVTWQAGRWIVEGEYANKHYTSNRFKSVHAWNLFTSYAIPLRHTTFNQLSFQGRFDGMTDHSTGTRNSEGNLTLTDPARRRITLGTTLAFVKAPVKAAVRLNYEKYFYNSGVAAPTGDSDKILAELIVKF